MLRKQQIILGDYFLLHTIQRRALFCSVDWTCPHVV